MLDESGVIPFAVGDDTIILMWSLLPGSLNTSVEYIVTFQETIDSDIVLPAFPIPVVGGNRLSTQFLNLNTGSTYIFTIIAQDSMGVSPRVEVTWIAGESPCKLLLLQFG